MAEKARTAFLKERVDEYLEAGIGIGESGKRLVFKHMLEQGDITIDEVAREYGVDGFIRRIITPVVKQRDAAGREKYLQTKDGGVVQIEFSEFSDAVWVYYQRKHHIEDSQERLDVLRQQIMDMHGADPEEVADPFEQE